MFAKGSIRSTGIYDEAAELRMISLKGLQQAITESSQSGAMVPDEVEFLAGLQRIQYVFVDEDEPRHHHCRASRALEACGRWIRSSEPSRVARRCDWLI